MKVQFFKTQSYLQSLKSPPSQALQTAAEIARLRKELEQEKQKTRGLVSVLFSGCFNTDAFKNCTARTQTFFGEIKIFRFALAVFPVRTKHSVGSKLTFKMV